MIKIIYILIKSNRQSPTEAQTIENPIKPQKLHRKSDHKPPRTMMRERDEQERIFERR